MPSFQWLILSSLSVQLTLKHSNQREAIYRSISLHKDHISYFLFAAWLCYRFIKQFNQIEESFDLSWKTDISKSFLRTGIFNFTSITLIRSFEFPSQKKGKGLINSFFAPSKINYVHNNQHCCITRHVLLCCFLLCRFSLRHIC